MAKSKIIKDLVNDEVSLTVVLNRLYVLASDLGNQDILDWANKEISGYKQEDKLPDYRIFKSAEFVYTGINGGFQVTNQPLSLTWLNPETVEKLSISHIRDSISEIESKANTDKLLGIDRSYLAGEVEKNTYDDFLCRGVQCFSIQQRVAPNRFAEILTSIKQVALKLLLELDKKFGNLDDLDVGIDKINKKEQEELSEKIHVVFNEYSIQSKKVTLKNSNIGRDNYIQKETKTEVEVSPTISVNNDKPNKWGWIRRIFGRKSND